MLEQIKNFVFQKLIPVLSKYVARWLLKYVGSVISFIGWSQENWYEFIAGAILFIFGIIWTLIVDKKKE